MKSTYTGFCRKAVSTVTLAMLMSLFAGCASKEFNIVASRLERGGCFYQVYAGNGTFSAMFDSYMAQFDDAIAGSKLPEEKRRKLRSKLTVVRWLCQLFGFREYSGFGASSVPRVPDDGKTIFSNRIFIAIDEEKSCLPDWIFRRQNENISAVMSELPAETFFAAGMNFSVKGALELLRSSGSLGEAMLARLPDGFPLETVSAIEGWGVIAAARRTGFSPAEDCLMLRLPDPKGKIFDCIRRKLIAVKTPSGDGRRMILPLKESSLGLNNPVMVNRNGNINLYNSAESEKLFTSIPNGKLKDDAHFRRYSAGVPERGRAFVYQRKLNIPALFTDQISFSGIEVPVKSASSFNVLTRTADGWLSAGNSDMDIPREAVNRILIHHLVKILEIRDTVKQKRKVSNAKAVKRSYDRCADNFQLIDFELKRYAATHGGKFPEPCGKAGLKELFSGTVPVFFSNVVYLGGAAAGTENIPVLLNAPKSHRNHICVMYADGKVKSYPLERPGSCRRMISFLYTVHRWESKVFQNLLKQAQKIDEASEKKE